MKQQSELPVFAQGAARLKSALQASLVPASRCKHPGALLDTLQHWSDSFLRSDGPCLTGHRSLANLGYMRSPLVIAQPEQLTAVAQVSEEV